MTDVHHAGFTRRIVGVPKAESDAILRLLFQQISDNPDFQVRFHWEPNSIAIWDNRVRGSLYPDFCSFSDDPYARSSLIPPHLTSILTPGTPFALRLMAKGPPQLKTTSGLARSRRTGSWRSGSKRASLCLILRTWVKARRLEGTMIEEVLPCKGK